MIELIAERTFDPPLSGADYERMSQRLHACLEAHQVCWRRSHLAADRRRILCAFVAPDAEAVREALRAAGFRFDRVWVAEVIEPRRRVEEVEEKDQTLC